MNLFLIPTVFSLLVSVFIFVFGANYINQSFESFVSDAVSLVSTNYSFSLNIMISSMSSLTDDADLVAFCEDGSSGYPVQQKLNSAVNAHQAVLGISVYGIGKAHKIASIGVSSYPDYDLLAQDDNIESFITGEKDNVTVLRDRYIAANYNFVSYDPSFGIVSVLLKVYDEDENAKGLILADLNTAYLYSSFFNYESYSAFGEVSSLIYNGEVKIKYGNNDEDIYAGPSPSLNRLVPLKGQKSLLVIPLYDDYFLGTLISLGYKNNQTLMLSLILLSLNMIIIPVSFFITKRTVRKIMVQLDDIVRRMSQNIT